MFPNETFIYYHDRLRMMNLKTTTVKMMIVLLLAGAASAAVYAITYPEAQITFSVEEAESTGTQISNLIERDGEWLIAQDFGAINESAMCTFDVRQRNTGDYNYTSAIYFMITCDAGIKRSQYNAMDDFVTLVYTDHFGTQHDCNTAMRVEHVSPTTVRITPMMDEFTFVPGYVYHTQLDVQLHQRAYGNYTIEVHVEEIE